MIFLVTSNTTSLVDNTYSQSKGDIIEWKSNQTNYFYKFEKEDLQKNIDRLLTNNVVFRITNKHKVVVYISGDKVLQIIDNPNIN